MSYYEHYFFIRYVMRENACHVKKQVCKHVYVEKQSLYEIVMN